MNLSEVNRYIEKVSKSEKKTLAVGKQQRLKVGVDLGTAYIVMVVLDERDEPIACEKQAANVLRDGVVVDYMGACNIVKALKMKIEARIGGPLVECAIAMPAGTDSSTRTHIHVAESSGMDVIRVLDEPTAANAIYRIKDGAIVDIGGGTTGIAVFKKGEVMSTADEPTGGHHLSLVISGNMGISLEEAEKKKLDTSRHEEILPIVRPVMEKMASIVKRHIDLEDTKTVYLCGGTCCLTGIEEVFEKQLGITVMKATNPFLITPAGIAQNCMKRGET